MSMKPSLASESGLAARAPLRNRLLLKGSGRTAQPNRSAVVTTVPRGGAAVVGLRAAAGSLMASD